MAKEQKDVVADIEETVEKASTAKKESKSKPKSTNASKIGFGKKISHFFRDLVSEVKKVVWPSKKQVRNNTLVVIAFCLVVGAFVCLLDFGLAAAVRALTDLAK